MCHPNRTKGFSLVEVMLVVAIIGIISGIAIPNYLGQRRRARVIGDAISNAKVLQMALAEKIAETIIGRAGSAIPPTTLDGRLGEGREAYVSDFS